MNVVIAGGTGFVGRALARRLREEGHGVTVLSRRGGGEGVRAWDPAREGEWFELVRRADAVVNLCGAGVADRPWTAARRRVLLESRTVPTRALALACRRGSTLVNASAVGYYGPSGDAVDEASPAGAGFLAGLCERWEAEARRAELLGARVVLLRLGVVLGRGGGALSRMLPPFRLGLGGRLGSGRQPFPWVHLDDAAGLLARAALDGAWRGPVNATAPGGVDNAAFTAALGRALRRPAVLPVPGFVLRAALGEMSSMLLEGRRVEPAAAAALGYRFAYPEIGPALAEAAA